MAINDLARKRVIMYSEFLGHYFVSFSKKTRFFPAMSARRSNVTTKT